MKWWFSSLRTFWRWGFLDKKRAGCLAAHRPRALDSSQPDPSFGRASGVSNILLVKSIGKGNLGVE